MDTMLERVYKSFRESSTEESIKNIHLPPAKVTLTVNDNGWIEQIVRTIPMLPLERDKRLVQKYGLTYKDARMVNTDPRTADIFEHVCCMANVEVVFKQFIGFWANIAKERDCRISDLPVSPDVFVEIAQLVEQSKVSPKNAAIIASLAVETGRSPCLIAEEEKLLLGTCEDLSEVVQSVIRDHPQAIEDLRGKKKDKARQYLFGKVMQATKGTVSADQISQILGQAIGQ